MDKQKKNSYIQVPIGKNILDLPETLDIDKNMFVLGRQGTGRCKLLCSVVEYIKKSDVSENVRLLLWDSDRYTFSQYRCDPEHIYPTAKDGDGVSAQTFLDMLWREFSYRAQVFRQASGESKSLDNLPHMIVIIDHFQYFFRALYPIDDAWRKFEELLRWSETLNSTFVLSSTEFPDMWSYTRFVACCPVRISFSQSQEETATLFESPIKDPEMPVKGGQFVIMRMGKWDIRKVTME